MYVWDRGGGGGKKNCGRAYAGLWPQTLGTINIGKKEVMWGFEGKVGGVWPGGVGGYGPQSANLHICRIFSQERRMKP